jgi:hypothetical protein
MPCLSGDAHAADTRRLAASPPLWPPWLRHSPRRATSDPPDTCLIRPWTAVTGDDDKIPPQTPPDMDAMRRHPTPPDRVVTASSLAWIRGTILRPHLACYLAGTAAPWSTLAPRLSTLLCL